MEQASLVGNDAAPRESSAARPRDYEPNDVRICRDKESSGRGDAFPSLKQRVKRDRRRISERRILASAFGAQVHGDEALSFRDSPSTARETKSRVVPGSKCRRLVVDCLDRATSVV